MKPLAAFASQFGAQIALNPEFIVENEQRFYLLNPRLKKIAQPTFYYAGLYLGKVKNGVFFPSFNFLNMLIPIAANKVVVDAKAAWLFICGRDLLPQGISKTMGTQRKGEFTLVLNMYGECLGFGRIVSSINASEGRVVVQNVLDVGDFLRREG